MKPRSLALLPILSFVLIVLPAYRWYTTNSRSLTMSANLPADEAIAVPAAVSMTAPISTTVSARIAPSDLQSIASAQRQHLLYAPPRLHHSNANSPERALIQRDSLEIDAGSHIRSELALWNTGRTPDTTSGPLFKTTLSSSNDNDLLSFTYLRNWTRQQPAIETVKPPVSDQFPRALQDIPIAARMQSSETIAYLAQHEIRYPERTNPYVALTFDCEMGTDSTRQILETLRQKDGRQPPIRATFFIMGQYAYVYPDIVREIAADGHELGNHSYRHFRFTDLAPITATNEIVYTEAAVNWALGKHTPLRYFRFPYGEREQADLEHLASLGYQSVHWNLDPRGWESRNTQEDVVEYIRKTIRPGGIVVMHCGCWNDVNALPEIIRIVRDAGLIPGTISDIRNYDILSRIMDDGGGKAFAHSAGVTLRER